MLQAFFCFIQILVTIEILFKYLNETQKIYSFPLFKYSQVFTFIIIIK